MILGIDEVGRGPWAGPLVVGAVVLGGARIEGLTDSKKINKRQREALNILIRQQAAGYGLGWVHANEIDEIGLSEALKLATKRAVEQIKTPYHEIIIDGTVNFLAGTTKGEHVTTMKKADLLVPSVSAASIIAKVARDNYMAEQDVHYEGYEFTSHVGYGTAIHRAAIEKYGVTPLHRLSFAPLAKFRVVEGEELRVEKSRGRISASNLATQSVTTKKMGDIAEDEAANYLRHEGHDIIERNWKTKYCEIDIVSKKDGVMYFTEVKYRKKTDYGDGFAAITTKKQRQMHFAARVYQQAKKLYETDMLLAAMSLSNDPVTVEEFYIIES